jgi:hypothetical protein
LHRDTDQTSLLPTRKPPRQSVLAGAGPVVDSLTRLGVRGATRSESRPCKISAQDRERSISAAWGQQLDEQAVELHEEGQQASHHRLEGKP